MVMFTMTLSDLYPRFKVCDIIQHQRTRKRYKIELLVYLWWPTNRKFYMVCRMATCSVTLNDPIPDFKVTPLRILCWISQKQLEIWT